MFRTGKILTLLQVVLLACVCSAQTEDKKQNDVDKLLTSNSLRAMSGSTSLWSISSSWNYNGGNLPSPFNQDRPNISGAAATTSKTDLDGSVMVKYGFAPTQALLSGVGLRYISPFNAKIGEGYDGDRFDVLNPFAIYQYVYNFAGVQAVLQAKALEWTQTDQTANGYAQQYAIDQESMYEVGNTGLSLALSTVAVCNTFNKNDPSLASAQSRYQLQMSPYAEYKINSKLNLKTMLNLFMYENYRSSGSTWVRDKVIQSVGAGYAFTRDIFFYPNISFIPLDIAPTRMTVSLSLTLNLF